MTFNSCCKRDREFIVAPLAIGKCQMWFSFLTVLITLVFTVQPTGCHSDWLQNCSSCYCNWNSGKKTADCKNKALTMIPNDLSTELQVIDLSNNIIPELRREEFQEANLQNLHKIFMRNCTLLELNRDALKGLAILIELDLSHNSIHELHPGTFAGLTKLRNLVMNNNEIEVLPNYLFAEMNFLSRVEFKYNRLRRIEVHAFGQLPLLSAVYLESNRLTGLRKETFSRTPKLLHLSLAQNPWNCTCQLQEFRDFVVTHRLYTPPTNCNDPHHLRGKLWSELPSENFACQPHILGPPRSYVEAQTDNVTLSCRFIGSPRPNVTWIYNKRPININDHRFNVHNFFEQTYMNHTNILTSELRIYGVRAADQGSYSCVVDNRGGRAESDMQLIVNGHYFVDIEDIDANITNDSSSGIQSNMLFIISLITTTLLLMLIIVVLTMCWYCRRIKTHQKDSSMKNDNGLISLKIDKTHNGSFLEGSVIMEMQKSLLSDVNPVEKPPRRSDIENDDGNKDGHETKKTLLDETQFGNHHDDETHSVALSDTTPRSRHTYVDDSYGSSLPPDLLAFPARVPTAQSMQSSHSNIPDQVIYGLRSPLSNPLYSHMTSHGIYGTSTVTSNTSNGFMTLQHPSKRSLTLFAATNSRQQQSPFVQAPVIYPSSNMVVMKQGYMTIPRKPRVPSWAPPTQLIELQSTTSPNSSETGTTNTSELQEPVYDNLGLRTTAGGNSTLNLHKIVQEQPIRYTMRDRPLPATPNVNAEKNSGTQKQSSISGLSPHTTGKIYEPIHELTRNSATTSETEPLYGVAKYRNGLAIVPTFNNNISGIGLSMIENKISKIPPRPPPKPKKKMAATTTQDDQGSTSQLFEDEGEDGTEV